MVQYSRDTQALVENGKNEETLERLLWYSERE